MKSLRKYVQDKSSMMEFKESLFSQIKMERIIMNFTIRQTCMFPQISWTLKEALFYLPVGITIFNF